jgi:hypothetical protein
LLWLRSLRPTPKAGIMVAVTGVADIGAVEVADGIMMMATILD